METERTLASIPRQQAQGAQGAQGEGLVVGSGAGGLMRQVEALAGVAREASRRCRRVDAEQEVTERVQASGE